MLSHQLVIADHRAGQLYRVQDGLASAFRMGIAAEHAGILAFGDDRWAFVDDREGTLITVSGERTSTVSVAIPAEHLASDPSDSYLAVTTGLGANESPWSDVVTLIDRDNDTSCRFRSRRGEPGVMFAPDQRDGSTHLVLRHREPGAIESFPLQQCLNVGPHVPPLEGAICRDIGDDGHGDVVDHASGIMATATGRGLERYVIDGGVPRCIGIVPWPVHGRAFYLRFDAATGRALGIVRGGPSCLTEWTSWSNTLVDIDVRSAEVSSCSLPTGLAFRFGLSGQCAAVATIHPDGDTLTVIDRSAGCVQPVRSHWLPPMSHPPRPGHLPWEPDGDSPAQRRSVAIDPSGTTIAVSRGGDGQVHLVRGEDMHTITVPTRLDEGGQLFWIGSARDPIGR
ncbi:hypothetical protein [Devriesea agamarum]|uniref:hypothetical protein n=1 Tax=Devriesea agamarum TaxID=472569 RepID=UPI00071D7019|nr:hypothetical protein [Devriesea agamarum]